MKLCGYYYLFCTFLVVVVGIVSSFSLQVQQHQQTTKKNQQQQQQQQQWSSSIRNSNNYYKPSSPWLRVVSSFSLSQLQVSVTTTTPESGSSSSDITSNNNMIDSKIISESNPLRVLIAGAGVGGLTLANVLSKNPKMNVTVLEQTSEFKRFGGPIQLASNALQILKELDSDVYEQINSKFTVTGNKINGIKDGIRTEWYTKFDLKSPAQQRDMPYTGVIERPELQQIYLDALPKGTVQNGDGVVSYKHLPFQSQSNDKHGGVEVTLKSGQIIEGDVLIGADGIWSAVRATMRNQPAKGTESGASYSGYTLFAGELQYNSFDHGEVGYKVYIGPKQYFVITDIGNGNYQWYAFLAREPGSAQTIMKPNNSTSQYIYELFNGWSTEIHHIVNATKENEIEQRDLYDRPPSILQPWTDKHVALLGDGIHAMMPNLGQGGCQAIEDAYVLYQELTTLTNRQQISNALRTYQSRRLIRSAAVQGLSRFASDIIIKGFDTPAKIVKHPTTGEITFENFNYAGIVTKLLQPILPIFFTIQFAFLYDGYNNKTKIDIKAALGLLLIGSIFLFLLSFEIIEIGAIAGLSAEAILGGEALIDFEAILTTIREVLPF